MARTDNSGDRCWNLYTACRRDVPRALLLPIPGLWSVDGCLWQSGQSCARLRNVSARVVS